MNPLPQHLPPEADKRFKILPSAHEEVRADFARLKNVVEVAKKWGVSSAALLHILFPELREEHLERKRARFKANPRTDEQRLQLRSYQRALRADINRRKRALGLLQKPLEACKLCSVPLDPNGRRRKFCSKVCLLNSHTSKKHKK